VAVLRRGIAMTLTEFRNSPRGRRFHGLMRRIESLAAMPPNERRNVWCSPQLEAQLLAASKFIDALRAEVMTSRKQITD
jgi:hypothetical protein